MDAVMRMPSPAPPALPPPPSPYNEHRSQRTPLVIDNGSTIRDLTSELLFEQYSVPSVAYCVDSIMSFYQNNGPGVDAFLQHRINLRYSYPLRQGYLEPCKTHSMGTQASRRGSRPRNRSGCFTTLDYTGLLRSLTSPQALREADRIVQFPFAVQVQEEKTPEELERIAERRREQGRKLQEMAARMRIEKLLQKETDLQYLLNLREGKVDDTKREWMYKLQTEGFDDDDDPLEETIKKLETDSKKARKKEAAADGGREYVTLDCSTC
ncbi:hypothetical protein DFH06DRAFT_1339199 [Mycena polygramma]|nr:hypothetical protein DFH06DRAFT_1339199 [Mycena polygramma]